MFSFSNSRKTKPVNVIVTFTLTAWMEYKMIFRLELSSSYFERLFFLLYQKLFF